MQVLRWWLVVLLVVTGACTGDTSSTSTVPSVPSVPTIATATTAGGYADLVHLGRNSGGTIASVSLVAPGGMELPPYTEQPAVFPLPVSTASAVYLEVTDSTCMPVVVVHADEGLRFTADIATPPPVEGRSCGAALTRYVIEVALSQDIDLDSATFVLNDRRQ